MDKGTLQRLLGYACPIAIDTGKAILTIACDAEIAVEYKEDNSPVTRADTAAHNLILAGLARITPSFAIVSEENDPDEIGSATGKVFWLVDPLDGTKEFIKGLGEYTVNIALIERSVPVLGVIYVPATDTLFYAAAGCGAWRVASGREPARIVPNQVTKPASAVVSRSHLSEPTERFLEDNSISDIFRCGSSLKMCDVADGSVDIYPRFGPTWLWDTGAGSAIAREAGCEVVDLQGKPIIYDPCEAMKHFGFIVYPVGMEFVSDY